MAMLCVLHTDFLKRLISTWWPWNRGGNLREKWDSRASGPNRRQDVKNRQEQRKGSADE